MRFVFFGSPGFAATVLDRLIGSGRSPAAVVANPDRPFGRHRILTPPATKELIKKRSLDIPVWQPEKPAELVNDLAKLAPDYGIVAAYARIIPADILAIPRLGFIGVHPSLLPKYRGASPIQSVILKGERTTGTTLYLMDAGMDHGPVIAQEPLDRPIADIPYSDLEDILAHQAGDLLVRTLPDFESGSLVPEPQDHESSTSTKKFSTDDGFVPPDQLMRARSGDDPEGAALIHRTILALNPDPGVWTMDNSKRLKLLASKIKDGRLKIVLVQPEGKKPGPPTDRMG